MKKVRWQKLILKTMIWLIAELVLNLVGIDDLADYSEFLFEKKTDVSINREIATLILVL